MTTVYFIRHAQPDYSVRDDLTRPLSEKGHKDCFLVSEFLKDKNIEAVFSSPYKRAIDTIGSFAKSINLPVEIVDDFRERKIGNWIDDFKTFSLKQWADFSYKLPGGESLFEVQNRNICALKDVLSHNKDKNIVIGTHGTALSAIINYYDNTYGFDDFEAMVNLMPWVVKMDFNDDGCLGVEKIDPSNPVQHSDMEKCKVITGNLGVLRAYRFVVIFARYRDKWLYCRAKRRDSFETAGGRIEQGETTLEAAKRELYEETGAKEFDIVPAFDYLVRFPNIHSNGQVFFAKINELENMPDYEMAEVKLFDSIPEKMRFPYILPVLYEKMQMWLNLQSAKDELWDVYDSNRNLAGRTHRRADPLRNGDYHLVVHIWLQNSRGEFLITKRAPDKGFPNMWECTGGSAVAGDDSLKAAIREVKEETGLNAKPENGSCVFSITREDNICDVWLFRQDFDINDVVLQENETVDAKYASKDEIRRMIKTGEFIAFHYIEDLFERTEN